jgi:hypothetical protein
MPAATAPAATAWSGRAPAALVGTLAALALAAATLPRGAAALGPVVGLTQVGLVAGWLGALSLPAPLRLGGVSVLACLAADLLLVQRGGFRLGELAGVLALALVLTLLVELGRRDRARVTDGVAATTSGVVLGLAAASLIALHAQPDGRALTGLALLAAAATQAGVRLPGRLPHGPRLGWLLGPLAGVGVGAAVGAAGPVGSHDGLVVGAAVAVAVGVVGAGLDVLAAAGGGRRWALAAALAPLAAAAPAAYLTGRLLVG